MLGTGARFFTCIFHYIFTATICFIMISLFYDGKLRHSEIERVALVVEWWSGDLNQEFGDSGTHVLRPFCQCLPNFIHSYIVFMSLPGLSVSLLII